jgi:hypothetical protein
VHAHEFSKAIRNAERDFASGPRAALAAQAVLDDVYPLLGLEHPPEVEVTAQSAAGRTSLTWNIDFRVVDRALGPFVPISAPIVLAGLAHSNRMLWSAAMADSDLYLPTPVSRLVSTKLVDARDRQQRPQQILGALTTAVDCPDIRLLVNSGTLTFTDVLRLREKAKPFRSWLQTQSERDTDAIVAYHHEVARLFGLRASKRALKMFGAIGGAVIGAAIGGQVGAPAGVLVGAGAGAVVQEGVDFIFDAAGKLDSEWRPVVFGDWARDYVARTQTSGRP